MKREDDIVEQLDIAENTFRRSRLRTMQRVAVGLLITATVLFAFARSRHGQHPGWGYLEAFAEAAMVGAIADWFAVVALFRHPLGIPVWHTAIIPNSKESIGKSLGTFVENHFITEEGIAERVRQADVAMRLGEWLLHPAHAKQVGDSAAALVKQVLDGLDDEQIRLLVRDLATTELLRLDLSGMAGEAMDALLAEGKEQELLDALLGKLAVWLADEKNHEVVRSFLMRSLDLNNTILVTLVGGYVPTIIGALERQLADARLDTSHALRGQVGAWIADSALHLKADPAWQEAVARYQRQTVRSDSVQASLGGLWDVFRDRLLADLHSNSPALVSLTQGLVEKTGRVLVSDPTTRQWLNSALESVSRVLVQRHRGEVTPFIEQQLAKWTKEEMSDRIELAIGRDLQFIRINGTLVGGLVGLLIHAVTAAF
jgi:uncharacterized membrane-anchored protein YjiN (DUF445 family)